MVFCVAGNKSVSTSSHFFNGHSLNLLVNIFLFKGHPQVLQNGAPLSLLFSLYSSHCTQIFQRASDNSFCSGVGFLAVNHASAIVTILDGSLTIDLIIDMINTLYL